MANKAIRGITVEIGGDTTKLYKALGESEKKSRSLQTELKEITKLLKFDPTNTELLAQKQAALGEIIEETSKKLDTLKEAEAQVVAQFERGEIGENQLRAFQREIMQTEDSLESLKTELSSTETALKNIADGTDTAEKHTDEYRESVEKAKQELADFKEKAEDAFDAVKTGAGVLGAAAVATGGYALNLTNDFDKAFNTLVTRTGASAEEMDALNEAMENVYANNFGDSIEDVAESMATVKQNTKLSGDELQYATERALLLRDTFEFDVNESTRAAKMLMDQYGLSAEEAYNLIAQGAQNGLDKNGDLLDTINEYGVHFSNLGLSAEDMFNMLTNGAENGTFSVDKLGDAVKEFGIRVIDGSDATAEGFESIGLDADEMAKKFGQGGESAKKALQETATALFNMDDPLKQNAAGVALFGTMWEDLGADGIKALMDLEGEVSNSKDALNEINDQKYDDIGSQLSELGRTLETDVVKPLGEELKPVVQEAIDYVKENGPEIKQVLSDIVGSIGDFIGWIVDNSDAVISTIVAIGTGLLVWNVAAMINGVVSAIQAYKLANEGATLSQALFNAVLNANPIMLIATLVAALVAGIVTFIMTNDEARAKFIEVWEAIKTAAGAVLEAILGFFSWAWEGIKAAWNACPAFFSGVWEGIKNIFSVVGSVLSGFFTNAWTLIKKAWSAVVNFFSGIWAGIKNTFSVVGSVLSGFFSGAWNGIKNIWNGAKSFFSGIWTGIKNTFSAVKSWFSGIFSGAWSAIKSVFSGWGNFFGGLWDTIKNKFSDIGTSISNAIGGAVKAGINGVISSIEGVINGGIDMINGAISLINEIPGVEIGKFKRVSFPRLAKGGIVENPTIAEIGEDGREAIIPLENNTGWLRKVARELNEYMDPGRSGDSALGAKLDRIYERLSRLQVVLDSGELVGGILDPIDEGLSDKYAKAERGW